jgi:hypothetical protein
MVHSTTCLVTRHQVNLAAHWQIWLARPAAGCHSCCVCALQVRVCGEESNVFKRVLVESDKWEVARPPNEVRAATTACTRPYVCAMIAVRLNLLTLPTLCKYLDKG